MNREATIIPEPRGLTFSQHIKDRAQNTRRRKLPGKLLEGNTKGSPQEWVVFFHGGAGADDDEWYQSRKQGSDNAAQLGEKLIASGLYSAGDVAVQMIANAEYDVNLIAGIGSGKNSRHEYQFDAFSMTPEKLGIVTAIGKVKNAGYAARLVQYSPSESIITGRDATRFAHEEGLTFYTTPELNAGFKAGAESRHKLHTPSSDTVGAIVAAKWNDIWEIAIAGSTGGMPDKKGGRVGDCGSAGSGFYVKREVSKHAHASIIAAALLSGIGEATMIPLPAAYWVQNAISSRYNSYTGENQILKVLKTEVNGESGWGALAGLNIAENRYVKKTDIVILSTVPYFAYSAYSNLPNLSINVAPRVTTNKSYMREGEYRRIKVGTSLSSA
jgi:isoaspartyl peptidase/L-asparaginase-like protein (Ntn-hydrolase superfamily)